MRERTVKCSESSGSIIQVVWCFSLVLLTFTFLWCYS